MHNELACFKAYDIRGKLDGQITTHFAYTLGRAFIEYLRPTAPIVLGADARKTSPELKEALAQGIIDSGHDVIDLGHTGTEEVYFATWHLHAGGGIQVTASHNPLNYNGFKLVRDHARPISQDSGLLEIRHLVAKQQFSTSEKPGQIQKQSVLSAYIEHLLSYIDLDALAPLRIISNSGNGSAGHVIDALEEAFIQKKTPIRFIKIQHQPDPSFPNGIPNPLLPERRSATQNAVIQHQANLGLAWDGDFDRCFFFDETGSFIEGYYIVGLLAHSLLQKNPGQKVIHDPRLVWHTQQIAQQLDGQAVVSKAGHAFIKESMRKENAIYGGEMSAHHYFRDFAYCDSGMIPWLLVIEMISKQRKSLSQLVQQGIDAYPCSGEINFKISNTKAALAKVHDYFHDDAQEIHQLDGISMHFEHWRFNLRASNTEPLVRLNIESKANPLLVQKKLAEIRHLLLQV